MSTQANPTFTVSASPRKIKSGPPLSWISGAVRLLRSHWGVILPAYLLVFIIPALIQFGAMEVFSSGSLLGSALVIVASVIVTLLLNAGMMVLFHHAAEGRPGFSDVFAGFRGHTVVHVLLMLVMMILVMLAFGVVGYVFASVADISIHSFGGGMGRLMNSGFGPSAGMAAILFLVIVVLFAVILFGSLFCYVVPLIVVARQGALTAIGNSVRACFKNLFVLFFFAVNAVVLTQLVLFPSFAIGASTTSVVVMTTITVVVSFIWGAIICGAYYLSFREVLLNTSPESPAPEAVAPASA